MLERKVRVKKSYYEMEDKMFEGGRE